MLRGRVKFPTGGIVHDHACVLMRCNSSTDGKVRMKEAVLFPPRIILGFFNARKDILMTEKNLINEIDDMKSLSEEDFAFANNGDCEDIAENEVCDNSQQAGNLGVETSENSQEEVESEEAKSDTDVEEDFATATDTEIDADIATGTDTDCDPCEKSCIIADIFEAICNAIKAFFEWLC